MQENKNLVQEALIQMKNVEEAIAQNAKGILASTMKEEINQLVKESLSEQDMEDEVELDVDMDDDTEDVDMDTDNEDEMDMELDMDMDMDSEESPIDLTDASDEEILRVFKAMGEEDGIIVKKDGEDIHLSDEDADVEYLVKLGESEEQEEELDETMDLEEMDFDSKETNQLIDTIFNSKGDVDNIDFESEEEGVMYEIEMEEESDEYMEDEYMEDEYMEYDMEEEVMYEIEMEEDMDDDDDEMGDDDLDESYDHRRSVREAKLTIKPKGVGLGNGPGKQTIKPTKGGFNEKMKMANPKQGTGSATKAKSFPKGENTDGKSKVVKAETKEGAYGMNKGDKSKTIPGKEDFTTKKGGTLKRKAFEKEETKEGSRSYALGSKEGRGLRKGITNNRNLVFGKNGVRTESTQEEVNMLREKNEEYRKALNVFREKLNEVAIFNSNLAYATRLFTEHSTTKKEKINILRRFDNVDTLKESKNLYRSIKDELSKPESAPMNESIETKLNKNVSTGSSTTLIESKTYENPQFLRMKDLMSKIG
jgi:hypothetical protein